MTTATISTDLGDIVVELYDESAPKAAANFAKLATSGFYDGVIFHRVIPGFVIQAGDGQYAREPAANLNPEKFGQGGPGFTVADDKAGTTFKRGTIAMANTGAANTGGSQFFIVLSDTNTLAQNTPGYAVFGSVTTGMDVADKIAQIPVGGAPKNGNQPDMALQPAVITSTTVTTP